MGQPIKKNKFSYFARSRLRLRPQEIWERDYQNLAHLNIEAGHFPYPLTDNCHYTVPVLNFLYPYPYPFQGQFVFNSNNDINKFICTKTGKAKLLYKSWILILNTGNRAIISMSVHAIVINYSITQTSIIKHKKRCIFFSQIVFNIFNSFH